MEEADFTNREIGLMFEELKQILARVEKTGLETKEQAIKTNGRVTELEKVNEKRNGAWAIAKYVGMVAIGLLLSYLGWVGLQVNDIHKTLSQYDVEIAK